MYKKLRKILLFVAAGQSGGVYYMDQTEIELIEKKKRSLKRYKKNLACIERLEAKLDQVETRMTSVRSPRWSDMPRGGTPVTMEDLVTDKIELEERIDRLKRKSKKLRSETLEEIDRVEDTRYADILEGFFIDCKTLEEIAKETGYTDRHVYRLYSEGVTFLALSDLDQ